MQHAAVSMSLHGPGVPALGSGEPWPGVWDAPLR